MPDLSTRIREAWLERNPEPEYGDPDYYEWGNRLLRLSSLLSCGAFESAVIQFLVPEGLSYLINVFGPKNATARLRHSNQWFYADTPAEALLSAIEAEEASDA
jgi:hypothetical protein